jgi:signal transduction histidine kinase
MSRDDCPPKTRLQHGLVWTYAAVTVIALLVVELGTRAIAVLSWNATLSPQVDWVRYLLVRLAGAAAVSLLLGIGISRSLTWRLRRLVDVGRAWLQGNLSLRIADPVADDLGLLAEQLDLIAEHLERDEQDLRELRDSSTRLTDQVRALSVSEERERLARELHDGVKQHLFSLAMTASAIRTRFGEAATGSQEASTPAADLAEMVVEMETTARTAQREMTRLIADLKPRSLEERGLAAVLNDYTLLFGAREHLLVYLDAQGSDTLLPPAMAETLYRVAQEALHNVARHARAGRVDVQLRCTPEQVRLIVRDNGVGFDTRQVRQGMGLANMQERMMVVSGRLTVQSRPGNGTAVVAEAGLTRGRGSRDEVPSADQDRPRPTIENWAWLGQRLVIPVGQVWPWLAADQVHLRSPVLEAGVGALRMEPSAGWMGLKKGYVLHSGQQAVPRVQVWRNRGGYEWRFQGAAWALNYVRGPNARMVLARNLQPLAAVQTQGRLLDAWSEIVYDGRGYRLDCAREPSGRCVLVDETGEEVLAVEDSAGLQIMLYRPLALCLVVLVALRVVDQGASNAACQTH